VHWCNCVPELTCSCILLQDILQAALHVEADLEQHQINTCSFSSPTLIDNIQTKLNTAGPLCDRCDSVPVTNMLDVRVSTTDTVKAAVDPADVFCLSQDDFNDGIDDLSFIDIPQHSQLPQGLKPLSSAAATTSTITKCFC